MVLAMLPRPRTTPPSKACEYPLLLCRLADGGGVTVGVVDSGVGTAIPALGGRVTAVGDAGTDCVGHGSFAAGLIAAALFTIAALLAIAYSCIIFVYRSFNLRKRHAEGLYYDKYGPTILCIVLAGAMLTNIGLRLSELYWE